MNDEIDFPKEPQIPADFKPTQEESQAIENARKHFTVSGMYYPPDGPPQPLHFQQEEEGSFQAGKEINQS